MNEQIPPAFDDERVDRVLAMLTDRTRKEVDDIIDAGLVSLRGKVVTKGSARVRTGDRLAAEVPDLVIKTLVPETGIEFGIAYNDDDIVVINKPAGLVVHPSGGHETGTLVHGLLARYSDIASVGDPARPGIVHRLDVGTSGLMIAARSDAAYSYLVKALAMREVSRTYDAVVIGAVGGNAGEVDAPIGRSLDDRTKMAVVADGRPARTHYQVADRFTDPLKATRLVCELETGRTHQIRVHMASIGHPVLGDAKYGGARSQLRLDRPFLHATGLRFTHPVTHEPLSFEAPMPDELTAVLGVFEQARA